MSGSSQRLHLALLGLAGFFLVLGVWLYLYRRPTLRQYQYVLAFERQPTAAERGETLAVLRARLAEFADPRWRAAIHPQMDGTFLLIYRTSHGPGALAQSMVPRGFCEIRLLHPRQGELEAAERDGAPDGYEVLDYLQTGDGFNERTGEPITTRIPALVKKEPLVSPVAFRSIRFWTEGIAKYTHVRFEFTPEDAAALSRVVEEAPSTAFALVVDGAVRVGFQIRPPIRENTIEIQELFDIRETEKLVKILRAGALPCRLRIQSKRSCEVGL